MNKEVLSSKIDDIKIQHALDDMKVGDEIGWNGFEVYRVPTGWLFTRISTTHETTTFVPCPNN